MTQDGKQLPTNNRHAEQAVTKLLAGFDPKSSQKHMVAVWDITEKQHLDAVLQGWFETTYKEEAWRLETLVRLITSRGFAIVLVTAEVAEIRQLIRMLKLPPPPAGIQEAITKLAIKKLHDEREG